jgi:hypothetical protein
LVIWNSIINDRAVLHLDDDIVGEAAVERLELGIGLLGAIVRVGVSIDEGAPHHDAAMRLHRGGEHVGAVSMAGVVIARAWLPLAVRLDEKAAEVGDGAVDLVRLGLPPRGDRRVARVGGLEPADLDGGGEARGEIDLDAIGAQHVRHRRRLGDVRRGQAVRLGVDVVEHGAVDADRGIGAGVIGVARVADVGQVPPVPDRMAGIAALHPAIEIVPMVEHA